MKKKLIKTVQFFCIACSLTANAAIVSNDIQEQESQLDTFRNNQPSNWLNYQKLEASNTNKARALAQQGLKSLKNGDNQRAIKEFKEAWSIDPELDTAGVLLILTQIGEKNYRNAFHSAKALQKNSPKNTQGFVLEGIIHSLKGNHQKSQASYLEAIIIDPGSPSGNQNLATYAININNFDKARKLYKTILQYHPDQLQTLIKLANLENLAGNGKDALRVINHAISSHPGDQEAKISAAHLYLIFGQPKNALEVINPILGKNEPPEVLLEIIGRAKLLNGQPKQAAETFLKWTKLNPTEKWSFYYLAEALEKLKLIDQAIDSIDKAIALDDKHLLLQFSKAKFLALKGNLAQSKSILLQIKNANDNNFSSYIAELQGHIALAENQISDAITYFKTTIKYRETNFTTIKLAVAYMRSNQKEKAYATLTSWLEKYPTDIFSKIALADMYLEQGQLEKAEEHYLETLKKQPNNAYILNNIAWSLEQREQDEKALLYAEKAYKIAPENVNIIDTLGAILIKTNKVEQGLRLLRIGLKKSSENNSLKYNLSLGLIKNSKTPEATTILQELASSKNPYQSRAKARLSEIK